MKRCKICLKTSEESISRWEIEFLRKRGICHECYTENKGLIKQDDHYVPWKYQNFATVEKDKPMTGDYEDCNVILPKISWCDKYKKWKLEFQGADSGGYDVETFVWYFDKKKDIISAIIQV
jgi:hypothetical protein